MSSYLWLQKYGGDTGGGSGTARKMRDELQDLDKQNEELKQDIRDLKQELATERRTAEKVWTIDWRQIVFLKRSLEIKVGAGDDKSY